MNNMGLKNQDLTNKTTTMEPGRFFCERHQQERTEIVHDGIGWARFCKTCLHEHNEAARHQAEQDKLRMRQEVVRIYKNASGLPPRFATMKLKSWDSPTDRHKEILQKVNNFLADYSRSTGLIFTGRPGTGKNHLACAIVNHFIENLEKTGHITTAFKIIRAVKDSWSGGNESGVVKTFRDYDILVIDEVGVQFGSNTEWIYLNEIINERYEWLKPTILISNLNLKSLSEMLGERVIDRFREGGSVLVFDWESWRGK